jgi:sugar O-acyltransferase (sialic acid O-acetyltransferase NeuD family)
VRVLSHEGRTPDASPPRSEPRMVVGMDTTPLVIIGAGGFGRELLDVVHAVNGSDAATSDHRFEFLGFLDDGQPDGELLAALGVRHLGPVSELEDLSRDVGYLIGIGDGATRRRLDDYGRALGHPSPVLVHPNSSQGFDVQLGPGTVVCSHVSMTTNIRIGRHVHLNLNSTVGHDTVLGDYVTVSPLVAISGEVTVEDEVLLGTGSVVNQRLTIGRGATLGSGAAAVRDVAAGVVAVGIPARARG